MMSKVEVLAFYTSVVFDAYFVAFFARRVDSSIEAFAGLLVSLFLMVIDISALRRYCKTENGKGRVKKMQLSYIALSRVESYLLVLLGLYLLLLEQHARSVLVVTNYILVNTHCALRVRGFASSEHYKATVINLREDPMPLNLIYYALVVGFEGTLGIVFLPDTIYSSLRALFREPWLPVVYATEAPANAIDSLEASK